MHKIFNRFLGYVMLTRVRDEIFPRKYFKALEKNFHHIDDYRNHLNYFSSPTMPRKEKIFLFSLQFQFAGLKVSLGMRVKR
jgi:hypothetical protein